MAALVYGRPPWVGFVCGSSIISERHLLTAAHCIDMFVYWNGELDRSFRAVIGSKEWPTGTNQYDFESFAIHPGWDWDTIKNDIGILKTNRDIETNANVAIIPLKFDIVGGGVSAYVTGWGAISNWFDEPDTLQLLYVNTLCHAECTEHMREANANIGPAPAINEKVEICTLLAKGHGMCNGDSGSALIEKDTQRQIGIVSWGYPCAVGAPDVFVRVSAYRGWLNANTGGVVG